MRRFKSIGISRIQRENFPVAKGRKPSGTRSAKIYLTDSQPRVKISWKKKPGLANAVKMTPASEPSELTLSYRPLIMPSPNVSIYQMAKIKYRIA